MKTYRWVPGGSRQVIVEHDDGSTKALRHVLRHSPDGFNCGYGGSGAADLALSILTDHFGRKSIDRLPYQDFKWDVIAQKSPFEAWTITTREIKNWLCQRLGVERETEAPGAEFLGQRMRELAEWKEP
jgi:hypothetical protein